MCTYVMKFLSWDCANRTLGWSYVNIDIHIYSKLSIIADDIKSFMELHFGSVTNSAINLTIDSVDFTMMMHDEEFRSQIIFYIELMDYFTLHFIVYESCGVSDVLEGNRVTDTTEIERTRYLRDYLTNEHSSIDPDTHVIIEHQPSKIGSKTNNKSTTVSHQIAFYYIDYHPVFIEPKLKNMIVVRQELEYSKIYDKEVERIRVRDEKINTKSETLIKKNKDLKYRVNKMHSKANFLYLVTTFDCMHMINHVRASDLDDLADSTMQIFAHLIKNKLFI